MDLTITTDLAHIVILVLATWRLSSLFVDEDGLFDIFERIRTWAGVRYIARDDTTAIERVVLDDTPPLKKVIAKWLTCRWCFSIWVGVVLAIVYTMYSPIVLIVLPWAISAGSILVDAAVGRRYRRRVYME